MTIRHYYIAILFLLLAQMSSAQTVMKSNAKSSKEIENSCRIKAKDIAAETYRGCVSEQKNAQMDQIKKEYQAKLQILKNHYEAELKKMAGKAAANAAAAPAAKSASAPEMNVQLKAADTTIQAEVDESTMDIPEPIPVDSTGI